MGEGGVKEEIGRERGRETIVGEGGVKEEIGRERGRERQ